MGSLLLLRSMVSASSWSLAVGGEFDCALDVVVRRIREKRGMESR